MWSHLRLTRDGILLALGAAGFIHEVWTPTSKLAERPAVLTACLLLMGVSLANRAIDSIRKNGKNGKNGDT